MPAGRPVAVVPVWRSTMARTTPATSLGDMSAIGRVDHRVMNSRRIRPVLGGLGEPVVPPDPFLGDRPERAAFGELGPSLQLDGGGGDRLPGFGVDLAADQVEPAPRLLARLGEGQRGPVALL